MSLVCSSSLSGTMQPRPASNPPTSVTYFEKILFTMTLEENTGPLRQPAWEGTHRTLFTSPQQQCGGADLHHLCLLSSCSSLCLFRFLIFAWLLLTAQGAFQPESLASIVPHSCLPLFPPDPHWPFTYHKSWDLSFGHFIYKLMF